MNDTINLAEHFYSPQCEGPWTGWNAYFLRVAGCNLSCGCSKSNFRAIKKDKGEGWDLDQAGDLLKEGKATWVCDSILQWVKHEPVTFQDLVDEWHRLSIFKWIAEHRVHLIYTGGEPTTPPYQRKYLQFLDFLRSEHNLEPFTEIETNGTQILSEPFKNAIQHINCSPKLVNSGMERRRRIIEPAIQSIMEHPSHVFKFVVANEDDVVEYQREFVDPFGIDPANVCMMPAEDCIDNFHENTLMVLELAKKYGYRGLQRMHISAWNQTTGV